MKNLSFVMDSNFNLSLTDKNEIYELENISTDLVIETVVDSAMEYELHIQHNNTKSAILLNKNEGSLSYSLTSSILAEDGYYTIQVRGIKGDKKIISNAYKFMVNTFINATHEPTPEEESIVEQILARVTEIESDVMDLADLVDEKQDTLVSGENIRTINGQSILGSGNIVIQGGSGADVTMEDNPDGGIDLTVDDITRTLAEQSDLDDLDENLAEVESELENKQDKLVSGTNIKTINGNSILGSGNIVIQGEGSDVTLVNENGYSSLTVDDTSADLVEYTKYVDYQNSVQSGFDWLSEQIDDKQNKLVSGTNIKTINGNSILGSGNIEIQGGEGSEVSIADNPNGGVDITVDGTSKTLAKQSDLDEKLNISNNQSGAYLYFSEDWRTSDDLLYEAITTAYGFEARETPPEGSTDYINRSAQLDGSGFYHTSGLYNDPNRQIISLGLDGMWIKESSDTDDNEITLSDLKKIPELSNKAQLIRDGLVGNTIPLTDTEQVGIENWLGLSENYISFSNTMPFTPTSNYHPATKKYVDEHSGGSITPSALISCATSMTDSEKAQFRTAIGVNFTNAEDEGGF